MIVYICCAGGATSGLYCNNIKKAAEGELEVYVDDIFTVSKLVKDKSLGEYDLILAYGAADGVSEYNLNNTGFNKFVDLILVSPQVRFHIKRIQKLLEKYNIPCEGIDMRTFGTMDGKKGLENIKKYINKTK